MKSRLATWSLVLLLAGLLGCGTNDPGNDDPGDRILVWIDSVSGARLPLGDAVELRVEGSATAGVQILEVAAVRRADQVDLRTWGRQLEGNFPAVMVPFSRKLVLHDVPAERSLRVIAHLPHGDADTTVVDLP